jgi:hypothetical protein
MNIYPYFLWTKDIYIYVKYYGFADSLWEFADYTDRKTDSIIDVTRKLSALAINQL